MKQKEIYLADLNPTKGSEQKGIRPVVVISGNIMNDNLEIGIICPISKIIKNYAGCVILTRNNLNNLDMDSEIISFQVRSISKERLIKRIGEISDTELFKVIEGLNEVLKY